MHVLSWSFYKEVRRERNIPARTEKVDRGAVCSKDKRDRVEPRRDASFKARPRSPLQRRVHRKRSNASPNRRDRMAEDNGLFAHYIVIISLSGKSAPKLPSGSLFLLTYAQLTF